MTASATAFWTTAFVLAYIVAPVSLIWGWARWIKEPKSWSFPSLISFVAFVIASASSALGLVTIIVGMWGVFEERYDGFYRVVDFGTIISLLGNFVAIGGIWRRSPLRWHALASAAASLGFWAVAFTWP
jgi:hypothetical protein